MRLKKLIKLACGIIFLSGVFLLTSKKEINAFAKPQPYMILTESGAQCYGEIDGNKFTSIYQTCTIKHDLDIGDRKDYRYYSFTVRNNSSGYLHYNLTAPGTTYLNWKQADNDKSATIKVYNEAYTADNGDWIKIYSKIAPKEINLTLRYNSNKPKCTARPSTSGTGYTIVNGLNGKKYLSYSGSGKKSVFFPVSNSYDRNGGAEWKGSGVELNYQSVNSTEMSVGSDGLQKGTTTNLKGYNAFNLSSLCTVDDYYYIDEDYPVCGLSLSPTGWTNQPVTISYTCSDGSIGCKKTPYSTKVNDNGQYTEICQDLAGHNSGNVSINITKIDKVAPTCGTTEAKNTDYHYNTSYGVKIGCSDNASGCTSPSYEGTASSSGNSTITIKDNAGNTKSCSATTDQFDTTVPTTTITLEEGHEKYNGVGHQTSSSVVATITAKDSGGAGIYKTCYKLSGAETKTETCEKASSISITLTETGKTTIEAWSYDNAHDWNNGSPKWNGNKSSVVSRQVYIDKAVPTISITNPSNDWSNSSPMLSFKVGDANSGVKTIEYVWAPTTNTTEAFNNYYNITGKTLTPNSQGGATFPYIAEFPESAKYDKNLSDRLYLHVRACDRAYSTENTWAPNCSTEVSGKPYKFDFINESEITVSGGGTDSGAFKGSGVDWTHKIEGLTFKVVNDTMGSDRSGIAKINLYFDVNSLHINEDKNAAQFTGTPDIVKVCSTDTTSSNPTTCQHVIDFAALKSDPVQAGQPFVATEGVRFIKVETIDLAGNPASKVFGPFKWDITKSKITSNVTFSGVENGKFFVDR